MVTWILVSLIVLLFWALGKASHDLKQTEADRDLWHLTAQKVFVSHCNILRALWQKAKPGANCPMCDTAGVILNDEGIAECPLCQGDPTTP